jgi:hypothetical protein
MTCALCCHFVYFFQGTGKEGIHQWRQFFLDDDTVREWCETRRNIRWHKSLNCAFCVYFNLRSFWNTICDAYLADKISLHNFSDSSVTIEGRYFLSIQNLAPRTQDGDHEPWAAGTQVEDGNISWTRKTLFIGLMAKCRSQMGNMK